MGGRDQLLVGVLANKNQGMTNPKTNISGISSVFRVILLLVVVLVVLLVIGGDRFKEHDAAMVSLYYSDLACLFKLFPWRTMYSSRCKHKQLPFQSLLQEII